MSAADSMAILAANAREIEQNEREIMEREPSFVTALSSFSVASPATQTSCLSSCIAVDGRVFRRLQRFHLLPSALKMQSDMVATYLLTPKVRQHVFQQRKHWWQHPLHLGKGGKGTFIRGQTLIQAILELLFLSHAAKNSLRDAQQLAETLILSGFLSPVHEAVTPDEELLEELYVYDDGYYELVAPGATAIVATRNVVASATITASTTSLPGAVVVPADSQPSLQKSFHPGEPSLSVWAVTDGATRAAFVQRYLKDTPLRTLLHIAYKVRPCYAVINKTRHHSLVIFDTDVARHQLVHVNLLAASVEYSDARDDTVGHALTIRTKVKGNDMVKMLVFQTKPQQEQWLLALVEAGAVFLETHLAILSFAVSSTSFYSLSDTDAFGQPFEFSELRGFVALLTNVPSGWCHTNAQQLVELVQVSTTYKDAGLKVVAFPSAQFGDTEFETDEELVDHLQQVLGAQFPVLATRDVNGPNGRDPMVFCKTKQPGAINSVANAFIENEFVKFLVSRDGRVMKRFGPSESFQSMEPNIKNLLEGITNE